MVFSLIYTALVTKESIYNISDNIFELKIYYYKVDGNKLTMNLTGKEDLIANYYFETEEEKNNFITSFNIGDTVYLKGELINPKMNSIPNTFNYKKYLYNKNIFYTLNVSDYELVSKNTNIFYKIKNYVYKRVEKIKNNEYIYALVLGETYQIDAESYRINGVSHLFSLSGLHVSLLAFSLVKILQIIKKILFKKKSTEESMTTYILIFIFLLLFSFITGFKPALVKSVIFFMLMGINKIYYFHIKSENLLIVTCSILLIINPYYIYDIAFQLSSVITFFLLFSSNLINSKNFFVTSLFTSTISLLSSVPIIINNFYTVNMLSLINNLFFVPFVSYIVFPLSIITLIFPFLNKILNYSAVILENVSLFLSNIKVFSIDFPVMNPILVSLYFITLILIVKRPKKLIYIIFLIMILVFTYIKPYFNKDTFLYFLDVSQGDSALIVTENNKSIVIDTGGLLEYEREEWEIRKNKFSLMKSTIIPFYKSIGLKNIDYLFLSHGDEDHSGYAYDLINNFKVKNVIINNGSVNEIENKFKSEHVSKYYNIDGVKIYSLNDEISNDENEDSLILLVIIDNKKILFMGDAGVHQEEYIIKKYNLSDVFILKVGHHGSNTSTSKKFIETINPTYSIISVGENNRFGHPRKEVLDTLNSSKIYRTDKDGTIMFKILEDKISINTYVP